MSVSVGRMSALLLSQSVRRGVLCGGGGVGEAAQGGHCMMEGWGVRG